VDSGGRTEEGENFRKRGERGGGQVGLSWAEMETEEDTPSWQTWVRSGGRDGRLVKLAVGPGRRVRVYR